MGHRIGVGYDGSGWFAVAELDVGSRTGVVGEYAEALPLGVLARTVLDDEFPVSSVQLVTHTVPAPSAGLSEQAACQQSYRELVGTVQSAAAAYQVRWWHRYSWNTAKPWPVAQGRAEAVRERGAPGHGPPR